MRIETIKPIVKILSHNGIGVSEFAARTCYDSFNTDGQSLQDKLNLHLHGCIVADEEELLSGLKDTTESVLLDRLAWVNQHHSILEHTYINFYIRDTNRGVLQEHARHRLQNLSVRSTRYTMSKLLKVFLIVYSNHANTDIFVDYFLQPDELLFTVDNDEFNRLTLEGIYAKLTLLYNGEVNHILPKAYSEEMIRCDSKLSIKMINKILKLIPKNKRNVGDSFKKIVDDTWKTEMVVTMNLRALKNFFDLRLSGAAWEDMRMLAEAMVEALPMRYRRLIIKKDKDNLEDNLEDNNEGLKLVTPIVQKTLFKV